MADRRAPLTLVAVVALAAVTALAACTGDDGGEAGTGPGGGAGPGPAAAVTAPAVPEPLPVSAAGTGSVAVGGTVAPFEVTTCRLEPDPAAPEAARALLQASGSGTTGRGETFTVEVQRFATTLNGVATYTDTIAYTDPARILQAQRIEVNGQVTDLRDPDATSALLRPRPDGVGAVGLASAPGDAAADGGLVALALDLTC